MPRSRTSSSRKAPNALAALSVVGVLLALAGCAPQPRLETSAAVERYAPLAEEVAAAISDSGYPLTSDDDEPGIEASDEGCRISTATYSSGTLLIEEGAAPPDAEPIVGAAEDVLLPEGFAEFELNEDHPMPMQIYRAYDDSGGWVHIVVESRPGRDTVRLWWGSWVDTQGEPCDDGLLS